MVIICLLLANDEFMDGQSLANEKGVAGVLLGQVSLRIREYRGRDSHFFLPMLPCLGQQETSYLLQPEDARITGIEQRDDNVTDPLNQPTRFCSTSDFLLG